MGSRGEEGEGDRRVRITDLNKASHFCVASSEIVRVLVGKRRREVKGEGSLFGGRGNSAEREWGGGVLCGLRPRAVFSGGRLLQLQHYYKAGLLGFMNKARK